MRSQVSRIVVTLVVALFLAPGCRDSSQDLARKDAVTNPNSEDPSSEDPIDEDSIDESPASNDPVTQEVPINGEDLLTQGQAEAKVGKFAEALAAYTQAIASGDLTGDQLALAHSDRGAAWSQLGDHLYSIEDYSKSIDLNSNSCSAYSLRGYERGIVGQYDLAEQDHIAAIDLAKSDLSESALAWALQHYADLYRRRGDADKALEYCDQARDAGNIPLVHFRRAWIYLDMGRHEDARSEFAKFEQEASAESVSPNDNVDEDVEASTIDDDLESEIRLIESSGQLGRHQFADYSPDERLAMSRLSQLLPAADRKITGQGSLRHPSKVQAIVITPDSQTAIVGLDDGVLLSYSLESQQPTGTLRAYSPIMGLALTASGDRLAVADGSGVVTLLDPATLKGLKAVKTPAIPERVVFSPDAKSLFVTQGNGHLLQLNSADLTLVKDIFPTADSRVLGIDCSEAGKVATSDKDGMIKLWSSSLALISQWKGHEQFAQSLAFDPSGRHLISGGADGELKVWRVSDRALVKESGDLHRLAIQSITFAPDGQVVTGGADGLCQFWDGESFEALKSYPNYRGYFTAGAVSADGRWLVRGGSSLDFVPMDDPIEFDRVAEYGGTITSLAVASGRKRFATGGLDRRLTFWEVSDELTSKTVLLDEWITGVAFCDEDKRIAAGLADGRIAIYSVSEMELVKSWPAHDGRINAIANVAGELVSLGDDGMVRQWDLEGTRRRSFDGESACRAIAVDGDRFAVGTAAGALSIYDATSEEPIERLTGRALSVMSLAFTRDGGRLMAGYFDGGLEALDTTDWTVAKFHPGKGDRVLSIAPHPTQDLVVVGYSDGYARVFDASLSEVASIQPTPVREVFAARWILEGDTFALAGASNAVSLWKLE